MAQDKKSFVAYSDWDGMFQALPDEIAGKLIKHIFSYVNDRSPKSDDYIINALFEQVKSTLKRDLKKWDEQKEQRSLAGKKSAESRSTKINERSTVVNETERKSTVNVSVSDNVTVNDNVINKEVENHQQLLAFLTSDTQLELGAMACKTTLAAFTAYAKGKAGFLIATTEGKYSKQTLARIIIQDFEKVRNEFEVKTKIKVPEDFWSKSEYEAYCKQNNLESQWD